MKKIIDKIEEYMFKDEGKGTRLSTSTFFLVIFLTIIGLIIGFCTGHTTLAGIAGIVILLVLCWINNMKNWCLFLIICLSSVGIISLFVIYSTKYLGPMAGLMGGFIGLLLALCVILSYLFLLTYHDKKVKQKNKMVENVS